MTSPLYLGSACLNVWTIYTVLSIYSQVSAASEMTDELSVSEQDLEHTLTNKLIVAAHLVNVPNRVYVIAPGLQNSALPPYSELQEYWFIGALFWRGAIFLPPAERCDAGGLSNSGLMRLQA